LIIGLAIFVRMTTIEHLIGDLLLRHNCVIVPSFGGFVAKQISAKIDYDKGTMSPPRKSLLFNKQLINNDGLLINELAQSLNISFDEAQLELSHTVTSWNRQLRKGKRIELDRVGMLFLDQENNICFEQDRFFNLLLASFGLGQVHFLSEEDVNIIQIETISRETLIEESVVKHIETELSKSTEKKKEVVPVLIVDKNKESSRQAPVIPINQQPHSKKRYLRYIAAACILPIAFYSIWIPMRTDVLESGVISIKDFNPFYKTSEGNYTKSTFVEDVVFEMSTDKTFDQEIEEIETDVNVAKLAFTDDTYIIVDISEFKAPSVSNDAQSYEIAEEVLVETPINFNARHLIVGCFGNRTNATNLVAKLKSDGLDALIVDVNEGLHRVSAGAALSDEALLTMRSKAENLGYSCWVLK
jgi:hypothetical protein